jgi:hypothetical protein
VGILEQLAKKWDLAKVYKGSLIFTMAACAPETFGVLQAGANADRFAGYLFTLAFGLNLYRSNPGGKRNDSDSSRNRNVQG